jgi:hypothetical protein
MDRGSVFDLVCPDLLDSIMEKAASGDSPSTLEHLAGVNRAFRASAIRCSQTLVNLQAWEEETAGSTAGTQTSLQGDGHASKAFQIRGEKRRKCSRYLGSGVVISMDERQGLFARGGPSWVQDHIASISVARTSLKTINLNLGSSKFRKFDLDSDIRSLVQAFPKLEELTLCEAFLHNSLFSKSPQEQALEADAEGSNVTSLDILRSSVLFFYHLPEFGKRKHLTALSSLKFRYYPYNVIRGVLFYPDDSFWWKHLHTLHLGMDEVILRNFMLQSMAKQCPNLSYLALSSTPPDEDFATPARERFSILDTIEKCPKLERLFISRGKMVGKTVFQRLVQETENPSGSAIEEIAEIKLARRSRKLLIREFWEDSAAAPCLKECRLYQAILPIGQRFATRVKRKVIGEVSAVQGWCKTFGDAKCGQA